MQGHDVASCDLAEHHLSQRRQAVFLERVPIAHGGARFAVLQHVDAHEALRQSGHRELRRGRRILPRLMRSMRTVTLLRASSHDISP